MISRDFFSVANNLGDSVAFNLESDRPSPNLNHGAGIDVSPAVRDYLGLGSPDLVDWRFVEQAEVPDGPWLLYDRTNCRGEPLSIVAELNRRWIA
jgi:hypothetical protein